MNDAQKQLAHAGSVSAYAAQVGELAAAETLHSLTQQVPEELRGSWPMVIAYARFQLQYELAAEMGDAKTAASIIAAQSKLVTDLY